MGKKDKETIEDPESSSSKLSKVKWSQWKKRQTFAFQVYLAMYLPTFTPVVTQTSETKGRIKKGTFTELRKFVGKSDQQCRTHYDRIIKKKNMTPQQYLIKKFFPCLCVKDRFIDVFMDKVDKYLELRGLREAHKKGYQELRKRLEGFVPQTPSCKLEAMQLEDLLPIDSDRMNSEQKIRTQQDSQVPKSDSILEPLEPVDEKNQSKLLPSKQNQQNSYSEFFLKGDQYNEGMFDDELIFDDEAIFNNGT